MTGWSCASRARLFSLPGLVVAMGLGAACQRAPSAAIAAVAVTPSRTSPPVSTSLSDEAPRWDSPDGSNRLVEDPVAGKRSEDEWRRHLVVEDRERLLARDRHALGQHKAIVALLLRARRDYDRARSARALAAAEARAEEVASRVEQLLGAINVWGNVSPLTPTYRAMVEALREDFPRTGRAARAGHPAEQRTLCATWDRQMREVEIRLRQAAASEGDGD